MNALLAWLASLFRPQAAGSREAGSLPPVQPPQPPQPEPAGPPAITPASPAIPVSAFPTPSLARRRHLVAAALAEALPGEAEVQEAFQSATELQRLEEPVQIAALVSQCLAESGGIVLRRENLNYSVTALLGKFSRARISATDAQRLGRKPGEAPLSQSRQEELANLLYGGEWGRKHLGNTRPGDGWLTRGAPYLQLTGRANWQGYADAAGVRFEELPQLLMTPQHAAGSSAWFWRARGCVELAAPLAGMRDAEMSEEFEKLTQRINGGTLGLESRRAAFRRIIRALDQQ